MIFKRIIISSLVFCFYLVVYYFLSKYFREVLPFDKFSVYIANSSVLVSLSVFYLLLVFSLLLPFFSAALILLIGVDFFGGQTCFFVGLSAGITAQVASYFIGYKLNTIFKYERFRIRLEEIQKILSAHSNKFVFLTFIMRALPNPFYEFWGYACGLLRLPFWSFFIASGLGGIIPLVLICFLL